MTYITEEEEKILDENKELIIERGRHIYKINLSDVYCYGIIDFNENSDDMAIISEFNWFSVCEGGHVVPSNYDYENHCAYSDINVARRYDTICPDIVTRYAHGVINKPKRTIIFKHYKNKK